MAEWTISGFKITMYKADHPPLHCHVRKDGKFVGKFNLESGTWMTAPIATRRRPPRRLPNGGDNMDSNELRFKHVGLSSDGAVIFCDMDNGKTYAMPLCALEQAEDWNPKAKPKTAGIIHDGYAAFVKFDTKIVIDFPSDFVLHICEPAYTWYKDKARAASGVGRRIREIREARGLTLDALAAKCGIAKPNLSRLEHDKATPKFETLQAVAAGLGTHPLMLVAAQEPDEAWKQTRFEFDEWRARLLWKPGTRMEPVRSAELVTLFLARWPEHAYARKKLLKHACCAPPRGPELPEYSLDAGKWARELAEAS